jgi:CDP-diacylglycerol--serine O-phosphatidyltransferase
MSKTRRKARPVDVIPSLVTLGNLVCGFGAITMIITATKIEEASRFVMAAWLILLALVFDALDGQIARWTRRITEFGKHLDTVCDAVSFGMAPALLIYRLTRFINQDQYVRWLWIASLLFAVSVAFRLARYTVDLPGDEEDNGEFQGLPCPAGAGMIAGTVLLWSVLKDYDWMPRHEVILFSLPVLGLVLAALMISKIRYAHPAKTWLKGKLHRFHVLVQLVFLAGLSVIFLPPQAVIFLCFTAYTLSGLVAAAGRQLARRRVKAKPSRELASSPERPPETGGD